MADYSIRIEEHQEEYEYLLNILSYKTLEGAKENVNWHVAQADGTVFSSVKLCPNGSACANVITDPSEEFSGDVNTYLLKFSFASGAANGTYNIFLEQNESLNLLNIEIIKNVSSFSIEGLGIDSSTLVSGDVFALNETLCEPTTEYLLKTHNYTTYGTSTSNLLTTLPSYKVLLQNSSSSYDSNGEIKIIWLSNIFNIPSPNYFDIYFKHENNTQKRARIENNLLNYATHFNYSINSNILTISNVDALQCYCDVFTKITNPFRISTRGRITLKSYTLEHLYFSISFQNRNGNTINIPTDGGTDLYSFLHNLTIGEVPTMTHDVIDLSAISLPRPIDVTVSITVNNATYTSSVTTIN